MQTIHLEINSLLANKFESIVQSFGNEGLLFDKFIEFHIKKLQKEIALMQHELLSFEQKYSESSDIFYRKFEAGEIPDEKDFILWSGVYEMQLLCKQKLQKLL